MDLNKMKQLEDIRIEHKKISDEHSKIITSKKEELFKKAISEFTDFFQEKGFTIAKQLPKMSATYKELKVNIEFPNPSDNFVGAYSVLKLIVSKPQKEYRITVNEIGIYSGSVQVETTYGTTLQARVDEADKEIKKLTGEMENMKNHGESFKKSHLGFTLYNDDKTKAIEKQFKSMKELLAELFQ